MKLETRDRVGFYTVPVAYAALVGQFWTGVGTDDKAFYVLFLSGICLSLAPFLSTFAASWRGELSKRMISKVPRALALAALCITFLSVPLSNLESFNPRIAAMAAGAGVFNLLSFRLVVGSGSLAPLGYWTKISMVTGGCVGFGIGFVSVAPADLFGSAAGFAIYLAANHWVVRSIIDNAEDGQTTANAGST